MRSTPTGPTYVVPARARRRRRRHRRRRRVEPDPVAGRRRAPSWAGRCGWCPSWSAPGCSAQGRAAARRGRGAARRAGRADVVHCYGHGGAGVTLSWGCAREVADLRRLRPSRHPGPGVGDGSLGACRGPLDPPRCGGQGRRPAGRRAVGCAWSCCPVGAVAAATRGGLGHRVPGERRAPPPKPNVVVIVADDLDSSLMPYMPHVQRADRRPGRDLRPLLRRAGHLLHLAGHDPVGGVRPQPRRGGQRLAAGRLRALPRRAARPRRCRPGWRRAGYRTAADRQVPQRVPLPAGLRARPATTRPAAFVPPGWDDWMVPVQGNAYAQDHYKLNANGVVDTDFHTELPRRACSASTWSRLVDGVVGLRPRRGRQLPLLRLLLARTRRTPTPRSSRSSSRGVTLPHGPVLRRGRRQRQVRDDRRPKPLISRGATPRRSTRRSASGSARCRCSTRTSPTLVASLEREGTLDNTYVMFLSDNGYHMGEHRREIGKYNQFEETVRVPLMIRGPGIAPGTTIDDVTGNVDLAPTIADDHRGRRAVRRRRRLAAAAADRQGRPARPRRVPARAGR